MSDISSPTFAVIGAGMIGVLYGAQLQQAGYDMTYLFHHNAAEVAKSGIEVDFGSDKIVLPDVKVTSNHEDLVPTDILLVALRTSDNHLLGQLVQHAMKKQSVVVLLQNGIGNEEAVRQVLDAESQDWSHVHICRGLPFVLAEQLTPGRIKHDQFGLVTFGAPGEKAPGWLMEVVDCFKKAGVPTAVTDDLQLTLWEKLALNVPANGLPVLFHASIGEISSDPNMTSQWLDLMEEVQKMAAADGYVLSDDFIQGLYEKSKGMPYYPSMMRHYDAKKSMEVNSIYQRPLAIAKEHGVAVPRTELLTRILEMLDARNTANQAK
ncbi:MAG: 2-dehydropantoate 2-reductase [Actinomycetia bacterium]|nr:2-dehydropantoate 2-reductase [Actinomycetes bacterium]MCH9800918.1 2-dehydropantoate 2-reductase [Actinomycetes bacterium]